MNSSSTTVTPDQIERASGALEHLVDRTPLQYSARLSELTGADVWLKREDLQLVRSYKLRGAYLFLSSLSPEQRERGIVAASAGNHAQGVALACARLGISGRIYVPTTTPRQKRDRIRTLGGSVVDLVITGETFDDAAEAARADSERTGATLVPPFDDPTIIAGQGTVIKESAEQLAEQSDGAQIDSVVVPVGGGGLVSGIGTWLRAAHPAARLIGVEPAGAASMAAALHAKGPVTLGHVESFVDGAAVRRVGDLPFSLVSRMGIEMVEIDEGAVCSEMLRLYQIEGIIAEPAGALAPAAVVEKLSFQEGSSVVVIISGGNNDVSRYNEVVERSLVYEGLKHYFLVQFSQEPGALRRFLDEVLGPGDDIVLFDYVKRNNRESGPALVGLEIGAPEDIGPLLDRIEASGMEITRIDPDSPLYRYLT